TRALNKQPNQLTVTRSVQTSPGKAGNERKRRAGMKNLVPQQGKRITGVCRSDQTGTIATILGSASRRESARISAEILSFRVVENGILPAGNSIGRLGKIIACSQPKRLPRDARQLVVRGRVRAI